MHEQLISTARSRQYSEMSKILETYQGQFSPNDQYRSVLAIYLDPAGTFENGIAWPAAPDLLIFKEHLQLLLRKGAQLTLAEKAKVNKIFIQKLEGLRGEVQKILFMYGVVAQQNLHFFKDYTSAIEELTKISSEAAKANVIAYLREALIRASGDFNLTQIKTILSLPYSDFPFQDRIIVLNTLLKQISRDVDSYIYFSGLFIHTFETNYQALQNYLTKDSTINYSADIVFKKGKNNTMPWFLYCLNKTNVLVESPIETKALLTFILTKLKNKLNNPITYKRENFHPLLWVINKGNPLLLDMFLNFIRREDINLACPVYHFNLKEGDFGQLEQFLEMRNLSPEIEERITECLRKHFLDDELDDFYEVEDIPKKAQHNVAVPMAVDEEDVLPQVRSAGSSAKTGRRRSGQGGGGAWLSRQDSKGIASSGEATQHYRRRKESLADFIVHDSEEEESEDEDVESIVNQDEIAMDVIAEVDVYYDADSEDDEPKFSYSGIKFNGAFQTPENKFVVHARGIHFYGDTESSAVIRQKLLEQEFSALHSPAVRSYHIKTELTLAETRQYVRDEYAKLSQEIGLLEDNYGHIFRSREMFHQQIYSNSGEKYKEIMADSERRSELLNGIGFDEHPFVSTSRKISEATRYGFGEKFGSLSLKDKRLDPGYDVDGKPKHPYAGILYVLIHDPETLQRAKHNTVINLYARGETHIDHRIVSEEEVSFIASVPLKRIFCKIALKFPSFAQDWSESFEHKYGINQKNYHRFKTMFKDQRQGQQAKKEIAEKLMHHLERKVKKIVREKMGDRKEVYESLEDTFIDRAPTLAVARLMRLYHLVVRDHPDTCDTLKKLGLSYLQEYIQFWQENKVKNPYLLKLITHLLQWQDSNAAAYFQEIAQYSIYVDLQKIIYFSEHHKIKLKKLIKDSMYAYFNMIYGKDFSWLERLLQCTVDQLSKAIATLAPEQLILLKKFRQFKDLEVSSISRLAIIFKAYGAKERDILAALPEGENIERGRATVAKVCTITLMPATAVTGAAAVPTFRASSADVLSESVNVVLDPENLFLAIQFGDKEFVENYLQKAQEKAICTTEPKLPNEANEVFKKRLWQHYEVFFITDRTQDDRDCYRSVLHYAAGYPGGVARPEIFALLKKRVFDHNLSAVCKMPNTKNTPLHLAAAYGSLEVVLLILRSNTNLNPDRMNEAGDTPLHAACSAGHFAVMRLIIEYGNTSPKNSKTHKTPCQLAREAGHQEIVSFLSLFDELMQALDDCFVDSTRRLIRNIEQPHLDALYAVLEKCVDTPSLEVKRLVRLKCESTKSKPRYCSSIDYGKTIAYLACAIGDKQLVTLLCRLNINVNVMPIRYESSRKLYPAFIKAVLSNRTDIVEVLLKQDSRYLYTTVKNPGLIKINNQKYGVDIFEENIQSKLSNEMKTLLIQTHRQLCQPQQLQTYGFSESDVIVLDKKIRPPKRESDEAVSPPKSRRPSFDGDNKSTLWRYRGAAAAATTDTMDSPSP
jgi:ankyrin repeat protein